MLVLRGQNSEALGGLGIRIWHSGRGGVSGLWYICKDKDTESFIVGTIRQQC